MDYATEFDEYPYDRYPYEAYAALIEEISARAESLRTIELYSKLKGIAQRNPAADAGIEYFLGDNTASSLVAEYEENEQLGWYDLDRWKADLIADIRYLYDTYSPEECIQEVRDALIWDYSDAGKAEEMDAACYELFLISFPTLLEHGLEAAGPISEPSYKAVTFNGGCFYAPIGVLDEGIVHKQYYDYAKLPDGQAVALLCYSFSYDYEHSFSFALPEGEARRFAEGDIVVDRLPGGRETGRFEVTLPDYMEPSLGKRYWSIDDVKDIAIAAFDGDGNLLDFGRPSERRTTEGGDLVFIYRCLAD